MSENSQYEISKLMTENAIIKMQLLENESSKAPPYTNVYQCQDLGKRSLIAMKNTHKQFPFGAIAELIDNAREAAVLADDGTVSPVTLHINLKMGGRGISITDNGKGIDIESLYAMVKVGGSQKGKNHIGQGFMSGTMGLGEEALVLTNDGRSRGLLFLSCCTNAFISDERDNLFIPIAFWHPDGTPATRNNPISTSARSKKADIEEIQDIKTNDFLNQVLCHLYDSRGSAVTHFEVLRSEFQKIARGGTRILIWRLHHPWRLDDCQDISIHRNEDGILNFSRGTFGGLHLNQTDIPHDYSLRSYCQILYHQPARWFIQPSARTVVGILWVVHSLPSARTVVGILPRV